MQPRDLVGGRFEIDRVAGTGGMGTVYRAIDRGTGAPIAVKVVTGQDAENVERFVREASVLAELSHPGIVRFVASGVASGGEAFLAMEWLEGESLSARLSRGTLSIAETIELGCRVASALHGAHVRGIVHRDIKPGNLFLPGGEIARVVILDFGIARMVTTGMALTRTGAMLGSPGYMSPEQSRGARDVDARSDLFSLACVLFKCLTGQAPFTGDLLTVMLKVVMDPAPLASATRPDVPPALEDLLQRMLAKSADARPRDAAAVAAELASLTNGRPPPPSVAPPSVAPPMSAGGTAIFVPSSMPWPSATPPSSFHAPASALPPSSFRVPPSAPPPSAPAPSALPPNTPPSSFRAPASAPPPPSLRGPLSTHPASLRLPPSRPAPPSFRAPPSAAPSALPPASVRYAPPPNAAPSVRALAPTLPSQPPPPPRSAWIAGVALVLVVAAIGAVAVFVYPRIVVSTASPATAAPVATQRPVPTATATVLKPEPQPTASAPSCSALKCGAYTAPDPVHVDPMDVLASARDLAVSADKSATFCELSMTSSQEGTVALGSDAKSPALSFRFAAGKSPHAIEVAVVQGHLVASESTCAHATPAPVCTPKAAARAALMTGVLHGASTPMTYRYDEGAGAPVWEVGVPGHPEAVRHLDGRTCALKPRFK